jgi:hypothetical protein
VACITFVAISPFSYRLNPEKNMEWELAIREVIGPDPVAINWWQMVIRGILIFMFSLMLARMGDNRIFGKSTTFDIVISIILGSLLSRAITGNAPFLPTVITTAALVMLHRFWPNCLFIPISANILKARKSN